MHHALHGWYGWYGMKIIYQLWLQCSLVEVVASIVSKKVYSLLNIQKNYRKSQFLIGKSTINLVNIPKNYRKSPCY